MANVNIEDLELLALDIINELPEISEEHLQALRQNEMLQQLVEEQLELRGAIHSHLKEETHSEERKPELQVSRHPLKRYIGYALMAAAVFIGVLLLVVKPGQNEEQVFTAQDQKTEIILEPADGNNNEMTLTPKVKGQTANISLEDYRELLSNVPQAEKMTLDVPNGQSSNITLDDGTIVCLHPGSRLSFPVKFTSTERVVMLEGEAYFKVTHDTKRPFTVMTPEAETTVLGTEFNVKTSTSLTEVVLVEGKVSVKPKSGESTLMKPGEKISVANQQTSLEEIDITPYKFWGEGYLYFDNQTLGDIMKEIANNYNMTVEFHNQQQMNLRMRFFADRNQDVDAAIKRMNDMKKVVVMRKGNTIIVE